MGADDGVHTLFDHQSGNLFLAGADDAVVLTAPVEQRNGNVRLLRLKDGVYYGDVEKWKPGTGTAFDLKFNVDEELFKDVVLNEDATKLTAKISAENLKAFIGTDLNATGDATVTLETNGYNLTILEVACSTANGQLSIRTSYTYNVQDLFPEDDVTEGSNTQNTESAE